MPHPRKISANFYGSSLFLYDPFKVVAVVLFNQLMGIPAGMIGYGGMVKDLRYVPDCYTAALQFLVTMIMYDAIFYHSHR